MKYLVVIPSGAVDEPVAELGDRTPLQAAHLPALDELARAGRMGTALTIPDGLSPSSEVSLPSALGYDPRAYRVPRGPVEARARGLRVDAGEQVFRCDLVTVTDGRLVDLSAGYIDTAQAEPLIDSLNDALADREGRFHVGHSFRHLLVWKGAGPLRSVRTTASHLVLNRPISRHLPRGRGSDPLRRLVRWSQDVLRDHDVNQVRRDLGENPANAVWIYGHGPLPALPRFVERFGLTGAIVAGTAFARGLGQLIGWRVVDVPGATGLLDTDLTAKAKAAIDALENHDLVCVHVEAADEAGHLGDAGRKIEVLEGLDRRVIAPLIERMRQERAYRILVLPDRATPVARRTHVAGPTIFVICGTDIESSRGVAFDEVTAAEGEVRVERGWELMEYFVRR